MPSFSDAMFQVFQPCKGCPEFGAQPVAVWWKRMLVKICDFKQGGCTEAKWMPMKQTGIGSQNGYYLGIPWKRVYSVSVLLLMNIVFLYE